MKDAYDFGCPVLVASKPVTYIIKSVLNATTGGVLLKKVSLKIPKYCLHLLVQSEQYKHQKKM